MPASTIRRPAAAFLAAAGLATCAALGILAVSQMASRAPSPTVADTTWGAPTVPSPTPSAAASPQDTTWG